MHKNKACCIITFASFLIVHQLEAVSAATVETSVKVHACVSTSTFVRVTLIDICNGMCNAKIMYW